MTALQTQILLAGGCFLPVIFAINKIPPDNKADPRVPLVAAVLCIFVGVNSLQEKCHKIYNTLTIESKKIPNHTLRASNFRPFFLNFSKKALTNPRFKMSLKHFAVELILISGLVGSLVSILSATPRADRLIVLSQSILSGLVSFAACVLSMITFVAYKKYKGDPEYNEGNQIAVPQTHSYAFSVPMPAPYS